MREHVAEVAPELGDYALRDSSNLLNVHKSDRVCFHDLPIMRDSRTVVMVIRRSIVAQSRSRLRC
jgi:hypothetical protein